MTPKRSSAARLRSPLRSASAIDWRAVSMSSLILPIWVMPPFSACHWALRPLPFSFSSASSASILPSRSRAPEPSWSRATDTRSL